LGDAYAGVFYFECKVDFVADSLSAAA